MHDLAIRGATVADGLGNPLMRADVAVSGERIAEVGDVTESARETVEADGLVLAPGIVDVHTHYDAQLTWESRATPSPALGVTTVVMGNCGFSIAPCPPEKREQMARNLAEVEGMSIAALEAGIDWSFEGFPDYLALLRRKGCYPNAGVFVGHSAVRTTVLGAEASERAATDGEIAAMRAIVKEAVEAGAIGFATSTSINHNGDGGVPMPSRLAEDDELRALVGVLGELGPPQRSLSRPRHRDARRRDRRPGARQRGMGPGRVPTAQHGLLHANHIPAAGPQCLGAAARRLG